MSGGVGAPTKHALLTLFQFLKAAENECSAAEVDLNALTNRFRLNSPTFTSEELAASLIDRFGLTDELPVGLPGRPFHVRPSHFMELVESGFPKNVIASTMDYIRSRNILTSARGRGSQSAFLLIPGISPESLANTLVHTSLEENSAALLGLFPGTSQTQRAKARKKANNHYQRKKRSRSSTGGEDGRERTRACLLDSSARPIAGSSGAGTLEGTTTESDALASSSRSAPDPAHGSSDSLSDYHDLSPPAAFLQNLLEQCLHTTSESEPAVDVRSLSLLLERNLRELNESQRESHETRCREKTVAIIQAGDDVEPSLGFLLSGVPPEQGSTVECRVTFRDILSLDVGKEVEGAIIDAFLFLLFSGRVSEGDSEGLSLQCGVWVLPTHVTANFSDARTEDENDTMPAMLRKWAVEWRAERGILQRMVLPTHITVNDLDHWVLYVVDVARDSFGSRAQPEVKIQCLDSLECSASRTAATVKGKTILRTVRAALDPEMDWRDEEVHFPHTPKQEAPDCGVFVVIFAICAAFSFLNDVGAGVRSWLTKEVVENWRQGIAATVLRLGEVPEDVREDVRQAAVEGATRRTARQQACARRGLRASVRARA